MKRIPFFVLLPALAVLNVDLCHARSPASGPERPSLMGPEKHLYPGLVKGELLFREDLLRVSVNKASISTYTTGENGAAAEIVFDLKRKSPLAAGLLGGLLGYGSGQFYAKRKLSGVLFLATDGLCTLLLIGGFTLPFSSTTESEGWRAFGAAGGQAFGAVVLTSVGGLGLIVSHVAQAICGPMAANRYNRELSKTHGNVTPFLIPGENSMRAGIRWCF